LTSNANSRGQTSANSLSGGGLQIALLRDWNIENRLKIATAFGDVRYGGKNNKSPEN